MNGGRCLPFRMWMLHSVLLRFEVEVSSLPLTRLPIVDDAPQLNFSNLLFFPLFHLLPLPSDYNLLRFD